MPEFDIVLKGGRVIDPANGIDGQFDVAIADRMVAAVERDVPPSRSKKAVDVTGLVVTPGLIDIHVHAFGGFSGWLPPDTHALPNGVTTVVDAGSSGWKTFRSFQSTIIETSTTRVLAMLNIVGAGMTGAAEQDVAEMDAKAAARMILEHPDLIAGAKTAHFGGPGWEAVDGTVEAARLSGTVAMIDFAPQPTRSYEDLLLKHLRPGDIHTHMYAQHIPILDDQATVNGYVRAARDRRILFDTGHGAGSFWFRIASPAMEQGFPPDTISTDLHKSSALIPNATMPATMSKFLNLGMPLVEVVEKATSRPAKVIGRPQLGTLSAGAEADIGVFELQTGRFGFVDSGHARMAGRQRLQCALTIRRGEVVWDLGGLSWPDWRTAGNYVFIPG